MLTDKYGREMLSPSNWVFEVQAGRVPGVFAESVRGFNPDVDTGGYEDMIPWGGLYAWPAAAVACTIVSTAAADAAAGTGARTVLVRGLNNSFAQISETVTLNGLTPVALANQYRRINHVYVITAGTDLRNIGTISINAGADILAQILPNEGIDKSGVYTVPAGHNSYIVSVIASGAQGSTTSYLNVALSTRNLGIADGSFATGFDLSLSSGGSSSIEVSAYMARFNGPRDFSMRCYGASANNLAVYGRLTIVLEAL